VLEPEQHIVEGGSEGRNFAGSLCETRDNDPPCLQIVESRIRMSHSICYALLQLRDEGEVGG